MRVYLDACSLQRPLDDRCQPRVNIEAEAVLTILRLVESGQVELLSSEALEYVAFASWGQADYFCTCDDKLLKKSKRLKTLATRVVSPLELIAEVAP